MSKNIEKRNPNEKKTDPQNKLFLTPHFSGTLCHVEGVWGSKLKPSSLKFRQHNWGKPVWKPIGDVNRFWSLIWKRFG